MKPAPTKIEEDGTAILDYVTPPTVGFQSGGMVTVGFDHGLVDRDGRPFDPAMFEAAEIEITGAGEVGHVILLGDVSMIGDAPFRAFRGTVPRRTPIDSYDVKVQILSDDDGGHPHFPALTLESKSRALRVTP